MSQRIVVGTRGTQAVKERLVRDMPTGEDITAYRIFRYRRKKYKNKTNKNTNRKKISAGSIQKLIQELS